jgi:hypothetical protein
LLEGELKNDKTTETRMRIIGIFIYLSDLLLELGLGKVSSAGVDNINDLQERKI